MTRKIVHDFIPCLLKHGFDISLTNIIRRPMADDNSSEAIKMQNVEKWLSLN